MAGLSNNRVEQSSPSRSLHQGSRQSHPRSHHSLYDLVTELYHSDKDSTATIGHEALQVYEDQRWSSWYQQMGLFGEHFFHDPTPIHPRVQRWSRRSACFVVHTSPWLGSFRGIFCFRIIQILVHPCLISCPTPIIPLNPLTSCYRQAVNSSLPWICCLHHGSVYFP